MKHQVSISEEFHQCIKAIKDEYKANGKHIEYAEIIDKINEKALKYDKIFNVINDV